MSAPNLDELGATLVSGAWADEVAHELATPVSFLEGLVQRLARKQPLDADDLSIAAEELARVRTLVRSLRRVKDVPRPRTTRQAKRVFEEAAGLAGVPVALDLPPELTMSVDDSYVPRALAPFLHSLGRHLRAGHVVGVAGRPDDGGATFELTGQVGEACPPKLTFVGDVWTAAAAGPLGLEMVVAKRIARTHGQRVTEHGEGSMRRVSIHVVAE